MKKNHLWLLISTVAISILLLSSALSAQIISQDPASQEITLSDDEFSDLFIRSLEKDKGGELLLAVSESLVVTILPTHITFSAVIDLDKVEKTSSEARQNIERLDAFLFFLDRNRLALTVFVEPEVRNALVGSRDNFSIQLGPIPISNDTLRQLGVPVENANITNLKLLDVQVQTIELGQGELVLTVLKD